MNTELRKYNLINWIINLNNDGILDLLDLIGNEGSESWEELPKEVQNGINEARVQADNGLFVNHAEQKLKYKKYLT
jgi:hypothetical protein